MSGRIARRFAQLREERRAGLVTFLCAGDPDFETSLALLEGAPGAGADLIEIGMQILFYMTPIIYPPEMLRARGMGWLMDVNPLSALVDVVRLPLLGRGLPDPSSYAIAGALVGTTMLLALLTLYRFERKVIFQL